MQRISPYPYGKCERIPIGIMRSKGISQEHGANILYCDSPKPALRYVRKYGGSAIISRTRGSTRWIRFDSNGKTIYPGTFCDDLDELIGFRDYCHEIGIPASGIPAMGLRLMRYTLPGYFDIHSGEEIPWEMFPPGARMHCRPGLYKWVAQADITAAYLWSIGQQSPASHFEYLGSSNAGRWRAMRDYPGSWALVRYRYRKEPHFGIIAHLREDGTTGFPNSKGWHGPVLVSSYDLDNLAHDADIEIRKSWIATETVGQPFRAFMYLIMDLRKKFPSVAKQAGNSLWGTFGASTDLAHIEYRADSPHKHRIRNLPPRPAISIPVAALTLSRLRAEMAGVARSPSTIHIHTDGFMTTSLDKFPKNMVGNPGEWRLANYFEEVEILTPSWYRTIDETGEESYKLAGRPSTGTRAKQIFRHNRDKEGRLCG
jgi:hypothetical protein